MKSPHGRRQVLQQGAALGAAVALGPLGLAGAARAQADADLAPYRAAKINWKQVEGETITVMVIPAKTAPCTMTGLVLLKTMAFEARALLARS